MELDPTRPVHELLDREEDTARIQQLIQDGRNLLAYGPRRIGKTSLVLATLDHFEKKYITIYVECTRAATDEEVATQILTALAKTGAAKWKRFQMWIKEQAHRLRVRLILRGDEVGLEFEPEERQHTIADALDIVGKVAEAAKQNILVALDEFQVVLNRDDGTNLAAIRSVVQHQKQVQYIFSGSVETTLRSMVDSRRSPFWKQLVEFPVAGVSIHDIEAEWGRLFPRGISEEAIQTIAQATGHTTLRLIEVLKELPRNQKITQTAARTAIDNVAGLHGPDYERDLRFVKPGNQRRCLLGIAQDQPEHPMGRDFIARHDLGTPASVRAALKRLRALEILDEEHQFIDPLFAHWLRSG